MALHLNTKIAAGLRELFAQLEQRVDVSYPINVVLAGGMAVHLHTATVRMSRDVDAEFSSADPSRRVRIGIPSDLMVDVVMDDGVARPIYFDTNYNSTFGLMHENYFEDAIPVKIGVDKLQVRVLSAVDLVVSKLSRYEAHDREDIASIVSLGLTTADEVERRATEAMPGYVGNMPFLKANLRDALAMIRGMEAAREQASAPYSRTTDALALDSYESAVGTPEAHQRFLRHVSRVVDAYPGGTDPARWLYDELRAGIAVAGQPFSQARHQVRLEACSGNWDVEAMPRAQVEEILALSHKIQAFDPGYKLRDFTVGYEWLQSLAGNGDCRPDDPARRP